MDKENRPAKSIDRRKRINIIKKIILWLIFLMIVVPTGLSIFFGIRLHGYKKAISELSEQLNYYLESQSEQTFLEGTGTQTDFDISSEVLLQDNIDRPVDNTEPETKPVLPVTSLTEEEIAALELSDEELYEGYRKVYLTFDDGPSSNTNAILDILARYDIKATFFVIKKDGVSNEKLYRRIVEDGHSLGMHSTSHVYKEVYASEEAFLTDTLNLRDFLYLVTGTEADLYRFPGGSSNHVSKVPMENFAKELRDRGIQYFDWNISSGDSAYPRPSAREITDNVTKNIKKYSNVVILMHDTGSRDTTVEALPMIIEYIQSMENTVILPLSRESKPVQHLKID